MLSKAPEEACRTGTMAAEVIGIARRSAGLAASRAISQKKSRKTLSNDRVDRPDSQRSPAIRQRPDRPTARISSCNRPSAILILCLK